MEKNCRTCWHCTPGTPWKGYCKQYYISVGYDEFVECSDWKEASESKKLAIAKAESLLRDNGYVEVK